MLKKICLAVFLIAAIAFAGTPDNWNGTGDSCKINAFNGTDLLYSKAFPFTDMEGLRVILKVNDTSNAGFAGDSIILNWGYQNGSIVKNSSGTVDTSWYERILVDTCIIDSFGLPKVGSISSTGTVTQSWKNADTLSVSGYAIQDRWLNPQWSPLIRFWFNGITGNTVTTPLDMQIELNYRLGTQIIKK